MREVKRSALVSQPPAKLFELINDIESYPQFLPWCTHTRVQSRTPREIVATLGVRQGALTGELDVYKRQRRSDADTGAAGALYTITEPFSSMLNSTQSPGATCSTSRAFLGSVTWPLVVIFVAMGVPAEVSSV